MKIIYRKTSDNRGCIILVLITILVIIVLYQFQQEVKYRKVIKKDINSEIYFNDKDTQVVNGFKK